MPFDLNEIATNTIILSGLLNALAAAVNAISRFLRERHAREQQAFSVPKLPAARLKRGPIRPRDPRTPSNAQRQTQARTKNRTTKQDVRTLRKVDVSQEKDDFPTL